AEVRADVAQKRARATASRKARRRLEDTWAKVDPGDPRTWLRRVPGRYTPPGGPRFNNPYGSRTRKRTLVTHLVRSIASSPGYQTWNPIKKRRMPCPTQPRFFPSEIKVASYSITDAAFSDALVAAHGRCVSVQVLMNSHLTSITSLSYGRIEAALGRRPATGWQNRRSFTHRCSNGCLGSSVLHSKIFLFSRAGAARRTVVTGSSNVTANAVNRQWNDLFTVNNDARLYSQFRTQFLRMVPDRRGNGPWIYRDGRYTTTFYPQRRATPASDETMSALRRVRCTGARGGAGIKGRTVIYIAMHAWFGTRGHYLTQRIRQLYRQGCYVRVLYNFMSKRTHRALTAGTGPRMQARRVLFPGRSGLVASKYSHLKMMAVSGRVGSDRSAWVVWTGSNNWTDRGNRADEVTLQIVSRPVYNAYVRNWKFMRKRRSTPVWAMFPEPTGGGRAP
ncbi:MAG: phospholipase D-like domain-containing protein, partial [Nocardioidaceae bacterium]